MKGIILALVLTLAGSVNSAEKFQVPVGKSLSYIYRGEALTGLEDETSGKAGLKFALNVKLYGINTTEFILMLSNPAVEDCTGKSYVHSPERTQEIEQCCRFPTVIEMNGKRIQKLSFARNTPRFCKNIVRGMVGMMMITYEKKTMYEAEESGIQGDCNVKYIVNENGNKDWVNITKTKNLLNCKKQVVQNIGMAYIHALPSFPVENRMLLGVLTSEYKVKFDGDTILIGKAEANELYKVSPGSEFETPVILTAKQELILTGLKTENPPQQLHQENQKQQQWRQQDQDQNKDKIYYEFSYQPQMAVHMIETDNIPQQIMEKMKELVQSNPASDKADNAKKYLQVLELVRRASLDDLVTVLNKFEREPRSRFALLNVVAMAGSISSLELLKTAVRDIELEFLEVLCLIPTAFHFATPNARAASLAAEIIATPRIRDDEWLNMVANLAYGALASRCASQSPSQANDILQPLHVCLTEATKRKNEQEIILCLKSLANAAHPNSMKKLIGATKHTFSDQIEVEIVLAMRQIARMDPKLVQENLFEFFMNREHCTLARIMACVSLLEMNISFPLVVNMAKVAANDNNAQFQRFVISHMTEVAGLRVPQYADVSSACKFALKLLKVRSFRTQYYYSKSTIFKFYDSKHGIGFLEKVITQGTGKTLFPSSAMLTTQLLLPGGRANLFEARLNPGALKEFLRQQIENRFNQKISKTGKEVPEVYPEGQDPSVSFSIFDKEIAYLAEPMKNLNEKDEPLIKRAFRYLQEGISDKAVSPVAFAEIRRRFPNNLGMPLEIGATVMLDADISANVRAHLPHTVDSKFELSKLNPIKLSANIDTVVNGHGAISLGIVSNEWQRTMEISSDFVLRIPLNVTVTANWEDKSYKIGFPPACKKTELVTAKHESYLVARNSAEPKVEKKVPLVPEKSEASLQDEHFESVERASREDNLAQKTASKKKFNKSAGAEMPLTQKLNIGATYKPLPYVDLQLRTNRKERKNAFLTAVMKRITGEHEFTMDILPGSTCAEAQMIEMELDYGTRVPDKTMELRARESQADESISETQKKAPSDKKQKPHSSMLPSHASSSSSSSSSSPSHSSSSSSPSSSSSSPSSSSSSSYEKKNKKREERGSTDVRSETSRESSRHRRDKDRPPSISNRNNKHRSSSSGSGSSSSSRSSSDQSKSSSSRSRSSSSRSSSNSDDIRETISNKWESAGQREPKHSSQGRDRDNTSRHRRSLSSSSDQSGSSSSSDQSGSSSSSDQSSSSSSSRNRRSSSSSSSSSSDGSNCRRDEHGGCEKRQKSTRQQNPEDSRLTRDIQLKKVKQHGTASGNRRHGPHGSESSSSSSSSSKSSRSSSSSESSRSSSSSESSRSSSSSESSRSSSSESSSSGSRSSGSSSSSGSRSSGSSSSSGSRSSGSSSSSGSRSSSSSSSGSSSSSSGSRSSSSGSSSKSSRSSGSSSSSSSSGSSSSSSEELNFLKEPKNPSVLAVYRVIYANDRQKAVLFMGYDDLKSLRPNIQVVMSNASEPNKPKAFMEAAILNPHKAVAFVKFGQNCNQYKIKAAVETGLFDYRPALKMEVDYARIPRDLKDFVNEISSTFSEMVFTLGLSQEGQRNPPGRVKIITVASDSAKYDVILKTPHAVTTLSNVLFPWSFSEDGLNWAKEQRNLLDLITNPIHKGTCSVYHNNLTTFSGAEIQTLQVPNCPLILAKSRYGHKQYTVMMMTELSGSDIQTALIFEVKGQEFTLIYKDGIYQVEINHVAVTMEKVKEHLRGSSITILDEKVRLVLKAFGEVTCYYSKDNITIEADTEKIHGQLLGLCGRFDGVQEFQTPNGYTAKNELSFVQAWVDTKRASDRGCNLRHSHVKPENTMEYLGEQSECYTVQPVLQCREGCTPDATTSVPVALHCLPAGSTIDLLNTKMRLDRKSEDVEHMVKVHRSCCCDDHRCAS